MGLLDKVKNLFTEEVEEPIVKKEEPKKIEFKRPEVKRPEVKREIQKQERRVEIAPARRESTVLLQDLDDDFKVKKEERTSHLYFEDDAFADLKPKTEKKTEEPSRYREIYKGKKEEKTNEKKTFKPSPIISPVYGVLDKNYTKDDITTRENTNTRVNDSVTVDDVRNKAFGTLEDELESNLLDSFTVLDNEDDLDKTINIFDELETTRESKNKKNLLKEDYIIEEEKTDLSSEIEKQKQKIEEINEIIKENVVEEKTQKITSRKIDNILEELDEIEELIPEKKEEVKDEVKEESADEEIDEEYEEDYLDPDDFFERDEEELEEELDSTEEESNKIENNEDTNDELDESELFNLIDSMYEKRDN